MEKILIIMRKEWLEIRQQRMLMLGILLPALLFVLLPVGAVFAAGQVTLQSKTASLDIPIIAGMNSREQGQTLLGIELANIYLLLPVILTSIIASYSIVGEKTSKTLEPLLATPVRTWELLLGKSLISLLVGVGATWLSGAIFIIAMTQLAVSSRVFTAVISPGWLIVFLLWTPLLALIAIAGMTAISSRVNDPRTAQQISAVGVVPFLTMLFGQLSGAIILGPAFAISVVVILAVLAFLVIRLAVRLFQREVILTRWK
jgi:ABC-2 type transport system permease protein